MFESKLKPLQRARKFSIQGFLSLIILSALIPPIILLALVTTRTIQSDRGAAEAGLVNSANVIASIAESSLTSNAAILRSLGNTTIDGTDSIHDFQALEQHFQGSISLVDRDARLPEMGWATSNLENIVPGESATIVLDVELDETNHTYLRLQADSRALMRTVSFSNVAAGDLLVALVDGTGKLSVDRWMNKPSLDRWCRHGRRCRRSSGPRAYSPP